MKKDFDDIFINNLPSLDLHGEIRDSARVLIKEFILDNYTLKNYKIVIIHGVGKGILKDELYSILNRSKYVDSFHLNHFNSGCTIVYLKKSKKI